jgi:hypothetical protein
VGTERTETSSKAKKGEKWLTHSLFRSTIRDKPALFFRVDEARPPVLETH